MLFGGAGDDLLYREAGNDNLIGKAGIDFSIKAGFGSDEVCSTLPIAPI